MMMKPGGLEKPQMQSQAYSALEISAVGRLGSFRIRSWAGGMMFSDIRKPEESKRVGGDFLTPTVALPYLLLTFTLG